MNNSDKQSAKGCFTDIHCSGFNINGHISGLIILLTLFSILLQTSAMAAPVKYVGDRETFFVKRFDRIASSAISQRYEEISATLVRKGVTCFIYLADDQTATDEELNRLTTEWDQKIQPRMTTLFGNPLVPGVDGFDRTFILLTPIHDTYNGETDFTRIYSYYDYQNESQTSNFIYSNIKEMIVVDPVKNQVGSDSFLAALASSFQKMIRWYHKVWIAKQFPKVQDASDTRQEDIDYWVDEGLSELAGYICGYGHPVSMEFFLAFPRTTLTLTFPDYYLDTNRGAAYLFLLYLFEKKGARVITEISKNPYIGTESVVEALKTIRSSEKFDELFFRWTIANFLDSMDVHDGIYGYSGVNLSVKPTTEVRDYPVRDKELTIYEQEVEYISLNSGDAGEILFYFYGDASNQFRIMSIKQSHLGTPVLEEVPLTANVGHAVFDRFGFDYDSVILVITNISPSGNGAARYSLIKRGPTISAFVNPVLSENIIINVLARGDSQISVLQQGMANEIPISVSSKDKTYLEVAAESGIATSSAENKLFDESRSWDVNEFANGKVTIVSGTGVNQTREILSNYRNYLTLKEPWATKPDSNSKYQIFKIEKLTTLYTGSYFIDRNFPGTAKILVRGKGADGIDGASVFSFSVIPIFDRETANIRIDFKNYVEQQEALSAAKVSAITSIATVLPRNLDDTEITGGAIVGEPFEISLPQGSMKVSRTALGQQHGQDRSQLGIYARMDGKWRLLQTESDARSEGDLLFSPMNGNWIYAVIDDNSPPSIRTVDEGFKQTLRIEDSLSGVNPSTLSVTVNGVRQKTETFNDGEGITVTLPETGGLARIAVADMAGNMTSAEVKYSGSGAVAQPGIRTVRAYPVPASAWMDMDFSWAGDLQWVKISIHDTSGLLMKEFRTDDINLGPGTGMVRWDLADDHGREVANGAYLMRFRAEIGTEKYETIRKIAVIR